MEMMVVGKKERGHRVEVVGVKCCGLFGRRKKRERRRVDRTGDDREETRHCQDDWRTTGSDPMDRARITQKIGQASGTEGSFWQNTNEGRAEKRFRGAKPTIQIRSLTSLIKSEKLIAVRGVSKRIFKFGIRHS